jgi:peptidoglycan/LPS O-acetylase OafA/YrhL
MGSAVLRRGSRDRTYRARPARPARRRCPVVAHVVGVFEGGDAALDKAGQFGGTRAVIVIFATLALSQFTPAQFPGTAIVPMILFYGNWYLMARDFFSPAGILWSVSIEEQFCLCIPLVMRRSSRAGLTALSLVLIGLAIISRYVLLAAGTPPQALWFCTLTRLDPIATGMLVCLVLRGRTPTFGWATRGLL